MRASTPPSLLTVHHLSIGYRDRQKRLVEVVRDVSFAIDSGETLGIVGETGCGKSTLALALLGYFREGSELCAGDITVNGKSVFAEQRVGRGSPRPVAIVPQNAGQSLTPTMRVGAQVAEAAVVAGSDKASADAAAVELLRLVRLPNPDQIAQRYVHEISGGQQQRVAIAMALASNPSLLVLDEPTTGLDVTTQAHILKLLGEIRARTNMAMVYVSHDLGVIAGVSDCVLVMYAGEIVEFGGARDVFEDPVHPYTRGLLASVPSVNEGNLPSALPGSPPSPGPTVSACSFVPRCAFARDVCRSLEPRLDPISGSHSERSVRCHRWMELDRSGGEEAAVASIRNGLDEPGILESRRVEGQCLLRIDRMTATYDASPGLLSNVRRTTESKPTVDETSFDIRAGEVFALVGESGSGKSTIARTIAGIHPLRSGTIEFDNRVLSPTIAGRSVELRKAVQLVFQNPDASLNPRQTVAQIIARPLHLFFKKTGTERRQVLASLLSQVGLSEAHLSRYPGQLSGGEKQRVALARALAAEPRLILCDEVTSSLDVSVQAAVLQLLNRLQRDRSLAYLFISHDLAVVRAIADRVAVLYLGEIVEIGDVAQVYATPRHPYTHMLFSAVLEARPSSTGHAFSPVDDDEVETRRPSRGCVFQSRCPRHAGSICDDQSPPWRVSTDDHKLRCHLTLDELTDFQSTEVLNSTGGRTV